MLTTLGGLGGAGLYGVFRPEGPVRGRRRAPADVARPVRPPGPPEIETPRATRGVVGRRGLADDYSLARPSWPWAPPWRSPSVPPWAPPSARRPSAARPSWSLVALAFVGALPWRRLGRRRPRRWPAASAAFAAAASARAVLHSAARALPAAVWAPLALPALPAAMRALAAFAAAALPVVLTTRPPVWTCSPPRRGVELARQARLAARGGVRVDGTDLGGAIEGASASARAASGSIVVRSAARRPSGPSRRRSSRQCGAAGGCRGGSGPDGPS